MTLKLISKNLPNKYAEQLYKNEVNYEKELGKKFDRLKLDYVRNNQIVDTSSQVFLNRIKAKRNQWRKDDLKYREHYKVFCRNSYLRYLANNQEKVKDNNRNAKNIQQQKAKNQSFVTNKLKPNVLRSQSESQIALTNFKNPRDRLPPIKTANERDLEKKTVYELIKSEEFASHDKDKLDYKPFQHGKYSICDIEFISKLPDKVELTVTNVGKKFIQNKEEKKKISKKNKRQFLRLQDHPIDDNRFQSLISYLD